jgi:hypothetical protein
MAELPAATRLPERLTITLWDFSWYVRTGSGEPFADLDVAFAQAVDPMWSDTALQQECNALFAAAPTPSSAASSAEFSAGEPAERSA